MALRARVALARADATHLSRDFARTAVAYGERLVEFFQQRSTISARMRRLAAASISLTTKGRYRSGQTGQTVNLLAYAFDGSNPSPTTIFIPGGTGRGGRGIVRS